jgi:hypothetical protein
VLVAIEERGSFQMVPRPVSVVGSVAELAVAGIAGVLAAVEFVLPVAGIAGVLVVVVLSSIVAGKKFFAEKMMVAVKALILALMGRTFLVLVMA